MSATTPSTPPRSTRGSLPSSPSFDHHPFSATAKAGAGMHPAFSKDHYNSPSHMAKLDRLASSSPEPSASPPASSQRQQTTPRSFGRCKSAPANAFAAHSPGAFAAGNRLQDVVEEGASFNSVLAGANKEERKRIQSQASLLFAGENGGLDEAFEPTSSATRITFTGNDDDCDWPAGQAEADVEASPALLSPLAVFAPRSRTSTDLASPLVPLHFVQPEPEHPSDALFEKAINHEVDHPSGSVWLIDCGLTRIPPGVSALANITRLEPAHGDLAASSHQYRSPRSPAGRSVSSPCALPPRSPSESPFDGNVALSLYLTSNSISALPLELFKVNKLTVLSLRLNKLETIPPAIGELRHLVELNLSSNKLTHLPSEILSLTQLDRLALGGNPWLEPPPSPPAEEPASGPPRRKLGPLVRTKQAIPSLRETCLRVLHPLSPPDRPVHPTTPILHDRFYRDQLLIPTGSELDLAYLALSRCPNPACVGSGRGGYFDHAEERMEWTAVLFDEDGKAKGAEVPVLWKGCRRGCLAFLDVLPEQE